MVAIRAALNLQHGTIKDFYICSLSSRYVILALLVISVLKEMRAGMVSGRVCLITITNMVKKRMKQQKNVTS